MNANGSSYNGKYNDDYVNSQLCPRDIVGCTREFANKLTFLPLARQFCCNDGTPEAVQAKTMTRAAIDGNLTTLNLGGTRQTASSLALLSLAQGIKPNDDYEKMQFYYHPDHLGSSSYITNLDGEVSQHIEYVPFGEVFIDELEPWRKSATEGKANLLSRKSASDGKANSNNTWNTPYLFNAKELDEETGMYYYGARYYEPRLSLWMSSDPLQEKYPNINSYCYTGNNLIKFVDPDGQKIVLVGTYKEKMKTLSNLQQLTNDNLIMNRATGIITIGKRRWGNRNSNFSAGTKLIQSIVKSKRTVDIEVNSNGDNKFHSIYRQNAYNGTGTDARITYAPNQKHSSETLVRNSKDGKSIYEASPVIMNIGRELVHAKCAIYGRQASDGSNSNEEALGHYSVMRPNGESFMITDKLEELQTTGIKSTFINSKRATSGNSEFNENRLRREHGYNERIEY